MMKKLTIIGSILVFALNAGVAFSANFPKAPHRVNEAEAEGLVRVNADELKELLNGPMNFKGENSRSTLTFSPDGSVERKGATTLKGKWHINPQKNAYCTAFNLKSGYQENCFAVFRSQDGIHFFDYDVDKGYDVHVWRRATEQ